MSQPKAIRVVPKSDTKLESKADTAQAITSEVTEAVKTKSSAPYEERLEKMSMKQLRGEVRKGVRGKLSGYCSIPTAVVLDVILDSLAKGVSPVL